MSEHWQNVSWRALLRVLWILVNHQASLTGLTNLIACSCHWTVVPKLDCHLMGNRRWLCFPRRIEHAQSSWCPAFFLSVYFLASTPGPFSYLPPSFLRKSGIMRSIKLETKCFSYQESYLFLDSSPPIPLMVRDVPRAFRGWSALSEG